MLQPCIPGSTGRLRLYSVRLSIYSSDPDMGNGRSVAFSHELDPQLSPGNDTVVPNKSNRHCKAQCQVMLFPEEGCQNLRSQNFYLFNEGYIMVLHQPP